MLGRFLGFWSLQIVLSFNLSPKFSVIISDPDRQEGSYFGYTVQLRSGIDRYASSIVIGAPRANSSYSQHRQIPEPGVIYQCNIDEYMERGTICYPLLLDPTGEVESWQGFKFRHRKQNSWLGAAIDGQDSRGGRLVACAPRWMNQFYLNTTKTLLNNGLCYWVPDTTDANRTAEQLIPLLNRKLQSFKGRTREYYGYAFGEAGFSVHMPKKDGTELLLGAPGLFSWKGGIIWFKDGQTRSNDFVNKRNVHTDYYAESLIPNTYYMKQITFESYFGYSVNSGIFWSGTPKKKWYVASAPRDSFYKGRVFLFDLRDEYEFKRKEIQIMTQLRGQQMGEYFGASLCVTDVNGDGLDDVIVGAPRHSVQSDFLEIGDEGAVYVFLNHDSWIFREQQKLEFAQEAGSQFGTCISALGDIDHDGFNDIAVGAPYEDNGRGAIYIYLGSRRGLRTLYSQHIRARNIHPNLLGFGISISRGIDIDRNYYNDVAVGAYKSGNVVLFRTQPVARLTGKIIPFSNEIGLDAEEFEVSICLSYNGTNVPGSMEMFYVLNLDPVYKRASININGTATQTGQFSAPVFLGKKFCSVLSVDIRALSQDFSKPIELSMRFNVFDTGSIPNTFCANCPMVDPESNNVATAQVSYSTGCGSDSNCTPDLVLEIEPVYSFVIGTTTNLTLELSVKNIGEPAFLTQLIVDMPNYLTLVEMPTFCNEPETGPISCDLGNMVLKNEIRNIVLVLDTLNIDGNAEVIELTFSVTSVGEEQNEEDNILNLKLPLLRQAQLVINAKSVPEQLQYKNEQNEIIDNVMTITQEFEIRNLGPSPISNSKIDFYIPVAYKNVTVLKVLEPETSLGKQSFRCIASYPGFVLVPNDDVEILESRMPRGKRDHQIQKRDVGEDGAFDFPANRTLFLNCTEKGQMDSLVSCMVVTCRIGLLEDLSARAGVKFSLMAQLDEIEKIVGKKDITQIEVVAFVTPLIKVDTPQGGAASFILATTLIGSLPVGKIPTLWIALAIALGLLILSLIVTGLTKSGFFKRSMRDDLQQLKEQSVLTDFDSN